MALLSNKLQHFKSSFDASTPPEILETINRSISLLQSESDLGQHLNIGDPFPLFELSDLSNQAYFSNQLIKDKPLIITLVRGGGGPYCMLEMQVWQTVYEQNSRDLNLVAITPELPQYANTMKQDNNLSFPLLVDEGLSFAKTLGLLWQIDNDLKQQLLKWNIDLTERSNCNDNFNVPVPATFVIDKDGRIQFRFIEEDYSLRAEPEDVLEVYRSLL